MSYCNVAALLFELGAILVPRDSRNSPSMWTLPLLMGDLDGFTP